MAWYNNPEFQKYLSGAAQGVTDVFTGVTPQDRMQVDLKQWALEQDRLRREEYMEFQRDRAEAMEKYRGEHRAYLDEKMEADEAYRKGQSGALQTHREKLYGVDQEAAEQKALQKRLDVFNSSVDDAENLAKTGHLTGGMVDSLQRELEIFHEKGVINSERKRILDARISALPPQSQAVQEGKGLVEKQRILNIRQAQEDLSEDEGGYTDLSKAAQALREGYFKAMSTHGAFNPEINIKLSPDYLDKIDSLMAEPGMTPAILQSEMAGYMIELAAKAQEMGAAVTPRSR